MHKIPIHYANSDKLNVIYSESSTILILSIRFVQEENKAERKKQKQIESITTPKRPVISKENGLKNANNDPSQLRTITGGNIANDTSSNYAMHYVFFQDPLLSKTRRVPLEKARKTCHHGTLIPTDTTEFTHSGIDFLPPSPYPKRKENQSREHFSSGCSRILFWKSAAVSNQRGILKTHEPTSVLTSVHDVIPRWSKKIIKQINKNSKERIPKCPQAKSVDYRKTNESMCPESIFNPSINNQTKSARF
ncbi:hypothetical protein CEXT_529531 [Caerostris extrusa]|uniref:Uncharacterized protein n=1 Tax=Caerostris extrusa TaxID=172846 RepID=A0AAV4S8E9_CAEEX|nr:hypothetical protein CEXT_529531 [Caerostris extrusa]